MTRRLFIAINASEPLVKTFPPTLKKLKINADRRDMAVKWVPLENLHVTLAFIGERPSEDIPVIEEIMKSISAKIPAFDLKVEDMGAFSSEQDARVLWLGVQNKKILNQLRDELIEGLDQGDLLFREEVRPYVPHLTIGRLKNPRSVKDMISPFKRKSFGKIHINEIVLYESKIQGVFPVYTPVLRYQLLGQPEINETESVL